MQAPPPPHPRQVYQQLVSQMFVTLERMAASNQKHGERLRLENYSYFGESSRPLLRYSPGLEPFMQQAEARQVGGVVGGGEL